MNFNDIKERLSRLYATLHPRFDIDIEKHTKEEVVKKESGILEYRATFGASSEPENINSVMNVVHGIAGLKDHLKNRMKTLHKNPQDVERLIDASLQLQLIIDLDNKDKHGAPLTRSNRSGKNPQLKNIRQGLAGGGGRVTYQTHPATGQEFERSRNVQIAVTADVVDEQGVVIMSFDQLVSGSMKEVEAFIHRNGLG